jgi:hypothetical protein
MRFLMFLNFLLMVLVLSHPQQAEITTRFESNLLLWPRFESEILAEVFPEGMMTGFANFWLQAEPTVRQQILNLYQQFVANPNQAPEIRNKARNIIGIGTMRSPVLEIIPGLWRLLNRDFSKNPHNTGDPDPNILLLQRALNFYFQGRRQIAEDGYIRANGETLQTLRLFRQEHNLLPAEKTVLDEPVLQAISVYALLAQRPLFLVEEQIVSQPERAPPSQTMFPEVTSHSIIMGLNRLAGRDLSKGQDVPDLSIMALQTALKMWLGPFQNLEVNGRITPSPSDPTLRVLQRFLSEKGLPSSTILTDRAIEELARLVIGYRP